MWAVLTRLEEPKKHNLTLLQKLKLYDGKTCPGSPRTTSRSCARRRRARASTASRPRYIQDKISNALVRDKGRRLHQPVHGPQRAEKGLEHHSLITNEDERKRYHELLGVVKQEYEDIVKNEVQRAICADEEAIARLCANYIDNVKAYTPEGEGQEPATPARTRSPTSG